MYSFTTQRCLLIQLMQWPTLANIQRQKLFNTHVVAVRLALSSYRKSFPYHKNGHNVLVWGQRSQGAKVPHRYPASEITSSTAHTTVCVCMCVWVLPPEAQMAVSSAPVWQVHFLMPALPSLSEARSELACFSAARSGLSPTSHTTECVL